MPQVNGQDVLIGCDPEVFLFDDRNQQFVSAHGVIEGTKDSPQQIEDCIFMVDGMALEFGPSPCFTEEDWVDRLKFCVSTLENMIPSHWRLVFSPTAHFSPEIMGIQPEEALQLGCEPDFNAYTGEANPTPDPKGANFRSAGGHVHVGFGTGFDTSDTSFLEQCRMLVRQLDLELLIPSYLWDSDRERQKLYGKSGAYRPKSYGLEYRSLSNKWMNSEELQRLVFRNTVKAIEKLCQEDYVPTNLLDRQLEENFRRGLPRVEVMNAVLAHKVDLHGLRW